MCGNSCTRRGAAAGSWKNDPGAAPKPRVQRGGEVVEVCGLVELELLELCGLVLLKESGLVELELRDELEELEELGALDELDELGLL